jgi:hypothetical protein
MKTSGFVFFLLAVTGSAGYGQRLSPQPSAEGMLQGVDEIVFAVRERGKNDHYYVNFGNWCGNPRKWEYGRGGRLCKWNVRTGETTVLIDDPPAPCAIHKCIMIAGRFFFPTAPVAHIDIICTR